MNFFSNSIIDKKSCNIPCPVCLYAILELLYQIYTETYISREIRRQTVCRSISKTSADYPMDHGTPRLSSGSGSSSGSSAEGPRSSPVSFQRTLWQDQPSVRESGILNTITPEECKYQEVVKKKKKLKSLLLLYNLQRNCT